VKPHLPDGCSLVVLFKLGNTSVEDYCMRVETFFDHSQFGPGYFEHLL
jgi:hypothetical protein